MRASRTRVGLARPGPRLRARLSQRGRGRTAAGARAAPVRRRGGREGTRSGRARGAAGAPTRPAAPRRLAARPPARRPGRRGARPLHGAGMAGAPRGRGGGGGGGGAGESGGAERAAGPGGRRGLRACDEEFACPELEALFRGYTLRLEQAATLKALAVLSLLAGALALAELLGAPGPAPGLAKGSHPVHCVLFLALLVVTNVRSLQVPQLQQVGQLALLFSLTFALLCCPFALGGPAGAHAGAAAVPATADQGVWQLLLVTFVSYALLPVRSLLAIGFGLVVAASHLLVTATLVPAKRPRLWRTVSVSARPRSGLGHTCSREGLGTRGEGCKSTYWAGGETEAPNWKGDVQGHSGNWGHIEGWHPGAGLFPELQSTSAPGCGVWRPETSGRGEGKDWPKVTQLVSGR